MGIAVSAALLLRIPFALDTPAERLRKEVYEAQLAQIDRDIELLQSSGGGIVTSD